MDDLLVPARPPAASRYNQAVANRTIRALLIALLAPLVVLAQEPDSELDFRAAADNDDLVGAPAGWAEETPLPGEPVKFRLRGASLVRILEDPGKFEISVDGEPIAATLVMPEPRQPAPRVQLDLKSESGPEEPDLVVDFYRGELPEPINRIELTLASRKLLCKAFIAAGDDLDDMHQAGEAQLVYCELKNGRLLQQTTLECDPGGSRYIRVRLVGAGGTKIHRVEGWLEPEETQAAYGVAAALGSMYDGLLEGEHKWPVILAENRLPLAKLKVLADAPGESRIMSVIREDTQAASSEQLQFTWTDTLKKDGMELTTKWVELSGESKESGLVIAVEDWTAEPLQLKGVQAFAYEVWLVFERPESDDVVLWLDRESAAGGGPGFAGRLELARAVYGGEFNEISLERPREAAGGEHDAASSGLFLGSAWFKLAAYVGGALVLLIVGLLLIRRPRPV